MNNKQFILELYKIGAIKLGSFTLKSGQISPIYMDLRQIISYPELMRTAASILWDKIQSCRFDLLCGVPYTALPIATCMSLEHNIPMLIRRKEQKAYGTKKKIEGVFNPGQSCLIVEDVVTTGSSVLETAIDLEEVGITISDIVVLIDREQGGKESLLQKNYTLHRALTLTEVLKTLAQENILTALEREAINQIMDERT